MSFVDSSGARLYWRSDGRPQAPVLLLGNSLGADHALWNPVLPALTRHFRVVRFDKRGHGASDASPGDYTIEMLAKDALAVADAAGASRFSYLGISIGGMIGQWLGTNAADRLERLVLANTSAKMPGDVWADRIAAVRSGGPAALVEATLQRWFTAAFLARDSAEVATVRSTFCATSAAGYIGCCGAIRDMDLRASAARIRVPTLVVTGVQDSSTPKAAGEELARSIPGATLIELPFAHMPIVEAPGRFQQAVLPFLLGACVETEAKRFEVGLARRKAALGNDYVEARLAQATEFNRGFQELITRYAWGEVWTRHALDDRTRRMLVLAITSALGRWEEFDLHLRAGLEAELTADDVKEALLVVTIYAGVPAANTAFQRAAKRLAETGNTT